jgi:hypothetical protein
MLTLVPRRALESVIADELQVVITERTVSVPLVTLEQDIERNCSMCALATVAARAWIVPPPVRRVTSVAPSARELLAS